MTIIDALIYSNIKNNLPNDVMNNIIKSRGISSSGSRSGNNDKFNQILSNTTIKRACALNRQGIPRNENEKNSLGVDVRIPIPKGYNSADDDNPILHTKYNYVDNEKHFEEKWR